MNSRLELRKGVLNADPSYLAADGDPPPGMGEDGLVVLRIVDAARCSSREPVVGVAFVRVVALICARGGSKGLPGKNIRPLAGRPLIAHAVGHAKAVARVARLIVSTDSEAIAAAAREAGADVPFMRPAALAQDDSPEWLVWRHALEYLRESDGAYPDALLVVPVTAPLRAVADLDRCLDEYASGGADMIITVTDAHRSPSFNMVKTNPDGTVGLVIPPPHNVVRRQDSPMVYDMTTVGFVANPEFVMTKGGVFEGLVRQVHVPPERALDIDSALDFRIAECLMGSS